MSLERLKMKLLLTEQRLEGAWNHRHLVTDDIPALASLVIDAYRGTIDDEGETWDEALKAIQDTFAGTSGTLLDTCSFVIEEQGQVLASTIVIMQNEHPLLAYVMTHSTTKNRGMARFLITRSINALLAQGYQDLFLFVTKGNHPAQHLYEQLGFQAVSTLGSAEVNGTRLFYEVVGEGHPLVFLHANLMTTEMWNAQWETFARHYRVIRYDQRGCGWSRMPPEPFSPREDLYQLLRFLGVEQAYLVGASLGGQVAIDFTLEHPEMVTALIAVGTVVSGEKPSVFLQKRLKEMQETVEGGDITQAVELRLQLWVDGPQRRAEQVKSSIREQVRRMYAHNLARALEQKQGPSQPLEPGALSRLGEIHVPTLVLVGEQDVPDILTTADVLMRELPDAQKVVIPAAAHLPSMEQPELFNRLTLDFLASL